MVPLSLSRQALSARTKSKLGNLPGVVFSGDQGGQLYIRGGSPIMNKVMMDGLTIYNPFHSIGLFSVFETDLIPVSYTHLTLPTNREV